ncbi:MAG TPA: methyltransferase, partial [Actinomycetota bacterium]|nr:methyltransferase [Actinomycetota bacterium]
MAEQVTSAHEHTVETTEDAVLDGRVRLRQPARGYRAGLDAALLAAACDAKTGERVMEV